MLFLLYFFVFLIGACVGSFCNVCIYRLPRGLSIIAPPSFCPICKKPIKPWHNIPILSFILLKGRCASCGSHISIYYPLIEAITGLTYLFLFKKFYFNYEFPIYALFFTAFIILSFSTLISNFTPLYITIPGTILGFIFIKSWHGLLFGLLFSLFLYLIRQLEKRDILLFMFFGSIMANKAMVGCLLALPFYLFFKWRFKRNTFPILLLIFSLYFVIQNGH